MQTNNIKLLDFMRGLQADYNKIINADYVDERDRGEDLEALYTRVSKMLCKAGGNKNEI